MSFPTRALALLSAAVLLLVLPSFASARPVSGIQLDGVSATESPAQIDAELAAVSAAHGKIVRVEVDWSRLQPRSSSALDPGYLASLDHVIDGAAARGIQVLLFVDRSPCWASSAPDKGSCSGSGANSFDVTRYGPTDPQDFVGVSSYLVQRYGPKLSAFEVWNEPDQINQKYWAGPDKIKRYVALTKAVYGPLKAINPQLQVLAGSFVGVNGAWLQALYDAGMKGSYDGIAVHFYDLPLAALTTTRAVQKKNGDSAPLWLTEFGWTSCAGGPPVANDHPCVTPANQGKALADVFRAVAKTSWLRAAIVYTLHDEGDAYKFGLLDRAGHRKPSFAAVRSVMAASKVAALRAPTLKLRRSGRRLAASGTGSIADLYTLTVYRGTTLRYKASIRTTPGGTFRVVLPSALGSSGLKVRVTSTWTKRSITRRH